MAMDQQMAPQAQDGGADQAQSALKEMIVQTDQALSKLAQVFSKISPQAGQEIGQIGQQFREAIQEAMSGGQGDQRQGQQQGASQMVSPETQGKPAQLAY